MPTATETARALPSRVAPAPQWLGAWAEVENTYRREVGQLDAVNVSALRREIVFCLLSGHGVSFELALSATDVVMALDPFGQRWGGTDLQARLEFELSEPKFDPRRKDGTLRRYRFSRRKAALLTQAREWVLDQGDLVAQLEQFDCERQRREWLCRCPGFGPKTASWLLRNIGAAEELAVLDVHILRAMDAAGRLPIKPRAGYLDIEAAFVDWCRELDAPVAALDLFLWEWQRSHSTGGRRNPSGRSRRTRDTL